MQTYFYITIHFVHLHFRPLSHLFKIWTLNSCFYPSISVSVTMCHNVKAVLIGWSANQTLVALHTEWFTSEKSWALIPNKV